MDGFLVREAIRHHPERDDPLAPARGILLGISLGVAFWSGIGLILWAIF